MGIKQFYGKKSKIMIKIPEDVRKAALNSFRLQKLGFLGGVETGWKRAKQLSSQKSIPIEDLRFMRNWYARHFYTSYPGYKSWVSLGLPETKEWFNKRSIISWEIWGGTPGLNWMNSKKVIDLLNKKYSKQYQKIQ
jgi:hypothetical protein